MSDRFVILGSANIPRPIWQPKQQTKKKKSKLSSNEPLHYLDKWLFSNSWFCKQF